MEGGVYPSIKSNPAESVGQLTAPNTTTVVEEGLLDLFPLKIDYNNGTPVTNVSMQPAKKAYCISRSQPRSRKAACLLCAGAGWEELSSAASLSAIWKLAREVVRSFHSGLFVQLSSPSKTPHARTMILHLSTLIFSPSHIRHRSIGLLPIVGYYRQREISIKHWIILLTGEGSKTSIRSTAKPDIKRIPENGTWDKMGTRPSSISRPISASSCALSRYPTFQGLGY